MEDYLRSVPEDYAQWLGGGRWSREGDALYFLFGADDCQVIFATQAAMFLEGFAARDRLPHFAHVVHLLTLFTGKTGARTIHSRQIALHEVYRDTGSRLRNAGALCAHLSRDIPDVGSPVELEQVCASLWSGLLMAEMCRKSPPRHLPRPLVQPDEFEHTFFKRLENLPPGELEHWLRHGCGSVKEAADDLAEVIPVEQPKSLRELFEELIESPRLSGAVPYVDQLVSALALPPRKIEHSELAIGGYADVTTRGQPEHLLPSQFAIDDPLEFIRRFAENELLYFRREEPAVSVREEIVVLLDQGVRAWGVVRLMLSAAVVACARSAERRRLPFLLAGTSNGGKLIDARALEPQKQIGPLLEASDLSFDPGLALETVLEERSEAPRDIVLLTQPRNLDEPTVRAAARRLQPGARLFAVSVDEHGAAELAEFRHGVPVKIRPFRVRLHRALPDRKPPTPRAASGWQGDVEPIGFPFRIGIQGQIAHFDFDASGRWLLRATQHGLLQVHAADGRWFEVLPRGMHEGKLLTEVDAVVGVTGGFVVGGRIGKHVVAVHYDMERRIAKLYAVAEHTNERWRWLYFADLHTLVFDCRDSTHAVCLTTGATHPPTAQQVRWGKEPYLREAIARAEHMVQPEPWLLIGDAAGDYRRPFLRHNRMQGSLQLCPSDNADVGPWIIDNPALKVKGVPIDAACHCGNYLLVRFRTSPPALVVMDLATKSIVAILWKVLSFQPSTDGRLLTLHYDQHDFRILSLETMTYTKLPWGRSHSRIDAYLGRGALTIDVGKWQHQLDWREGKLDLRSNGHRAHKARGIKAIPRGLPEQVSYYRPRFYGSCAVAGLTVVTDMHGQAAIFDDKGKLICMFFVFRGQLAGWMPDGTSFGPPSLINETTPDAHEKFGVALRAAAARTESELSTFERPERVL